MASHNHPLKRRPDNAQRQVGDRQPSDPQRSSQDTAGSRHHRHSDESHLQPVDGYRQARDTAVDSYQRQSYETQRSRAGDPQRPTHDTAGSSRQGQPRDKRRQPSDAADINNQQQSFNTAAGSYRGPIYDAPRYPGDTQWQPRDIAHSSHQQQQPYSTQQEPVYTQGPPYDIPQPIHNTNSYRGPSSDPRLPHDANHALAQANPVSGPSGRPSGVDLTTYVSIMSAPGQKFPWTLATGAFTDVFKGEYRRPGANKIFVAVKVFRVSMNVDSKQKIEDVNRRLIRESDVWLQLEHPNIQPYLGHCSDLSLCVALISPFCGHNTVMDYITRNPSANRLELINDVVSGLRYLDSQDVIHGDLHCNNILVNEAKHAVLTDFGRAKVIEKAGFGTTLFAGRASYMAPELLPKDDSVDVDKQFSKKSDIYAFGMLCYEMSIGEPPFACHNVSQDWQVVPLVHSGMRPKYTSHVKGCISDNMWRMMMACWETVPINRPSAEQIIRRMF